MDVQPYVVHAAYGVTEELMVAMGSGIVYYDGGESDFLPYVASKFLVFDNEQATVALGGYMGLFMSVEDVAYYGVSGAVFQKRGKPRGAPGRRPVRGCRRWRDRQ